jgi:hypothetical protein
MRASPSFHGSRGGLASPGRASTPNSRPRRTRSRSPRCFCYSPRPSALGNLRRSSCVLAAARRRTSAAEDLLLGRRARLRVSSCRGAARPRDEGAQNPPRRRRNPRAADRRRNRPPPARQRHPLPDRTRRPTTVRFREHDQRPETPDAQSWYRRSAIDLALAWPRSTSFGWSRITDCWTEAIRLGGPSALRNAPASSRRG